MFTQLLSQPPIALNKAKPEIQYHPEVEAVVMKGLAKLPKDRYPDVVAFADALGAVLKDPFPANTGGSGFMSKMKGLFGR
jgi:serine/threonine-protein kinase